MAKRLGNSQCGVPVTQLNDTQALTFMFALTSLLVLVRLTVKFLGHGGGWGADDWLIFVSIVCHSALFPHDPPPLSMNGLFLLDDVC